MHKFTPMNKSIFWILLSLLISSVACKKSNNTTPLVTEVKIFTENNLPVTDIFFLNKDTGVAISGEGDHTSPVFAITYNGGETWKYITMMVDGEKITKINNIQALNSNFIYATFASATGNTGVCITTDRGETWKSLKIEPRGINYHSAIFENSQIGFVNQSNAILKTINGGASWKEVFYLGFMGGFGRTFFTSKNIGFSFGGATIDGSSGGIIVKTSDAGETWKTLNFDAEGGQVTSLTFKNDLEGYAFTFLNKAYKTADGGETWNLIQRNLPESYFSSAFNSGYLYFANSRKIYRSKDNLSTYSEVYSYPTDMSLDVKAMSPVDGILYFKTKFGFIKVIINP